MLRLRPLVCQSRRNGSARGNRSRFSTEVEDTVCKYVCERLIWHGSEDDHTLLIPRFEERRSRMIRPLHLFHHNCSVTANHSFHAQAQSLPINHPAPTYSPRHTPAEPPSARQSHKSTTKPSAHRPHHPPPPSPPRNPLTHSLNNISSPNAHPTARPRYHAVSGADTRTSQYRSCPSVTSIVGG